jgi:hypothetical protein
LVVWTIWIIFPEILGISWSQLTFIFFRGLETTNQYCSLPECLHYSNLSE